MIERWTSNGAFDISLTMSCLSLWQIVEWLLWHNALFACDIFRSCFNCSYLMFPRFTVKSFSSKFRTWSRSMCFVFAQVQYYERLSPLVPLNLPLGSFSNIRTGDCIVTFSRRKIYKLKVSQSPNWFIFFYLYLFFISVPHA